jgi:8-oxo-dGTP diphosphatase
MTDYDPHAFPPFAVTVDLVVLTVRDGELNVLLVRRGVTPYRGRWALPGGFVYIDEDLRDAAVRELREETGLRLRDVHLEQLATYGAPRRDPRMRVVSTAWLVVAANLPSPVAGTDAADASWRPVDAACSSGRLAFDHASILRDGVERARAKLEYSSLGATFCADEFTVSELRAVYEAVWGIEVDPRNFHRKVTGTPGFLVETGRTTTRGGGRPAMLYTARDAVLNPPILRA